VTTPTLSDSIGAARTIKCYGAITALARCYDPRILVEGPADTGKSSGILRVFEHYAWNCPGIRVLLLRQTMQSLRESTLATLEEKVWAPMMDGKRHPAQHGTALRANRRDYVFPNGTRYVIGGLEDPGWTYSMEYDLIGGFEAWEFSRDSIERLYRANRNHVLCRYAPWNRGLTELVGARWVKNEFGVAVPKGANWMDECWAKYHGVTDPATIAAAPAKVRELAAKNPSGHFGCWQQMVLDTNPSSEFAQLNQMAAPIGGVELERIKDEKPPSRRVFRSPTHPFTRILSRHEDNPACTEDDLAKLKALTGHRRANLFLGLWQGAAGQIWPSFDPTVHMVTFEVEREGERDPASVPLTEAEKAANVKKNVISDRRPMRLHFLGDRGPWLPERLDVKWAFASQDLGYRNAGALQVWLVTYDDRIFRAAEVHRREMLDDWWTERVLDFWIEFDLHAAVLDCEDPERIVKINDRLEAKGALSIAQGVDKSVRKGNRTKFVPTSLDLVREMLLPTQKGGPRMYWGRNGLREGRCPISAEKFLPCASEEEIGGFVFREHEDGRPDDEEPDPAVPQDGCAATRYAAVYQWLMDPKGPKVVERHPIGTAGHRMGHEDVMRRSNGRTR